MIRVRKGHRLRPRARAMGVVVALVAAGLTVGAPGAKALTKCAQPAATPPYILSTANGLCVSIEYGWQDPARYGMLRARANVHGPWEDVEISPLPKGQHGYLPCVWPAPAGWTCEFAAHIAHADGNYTEARFVTVRSEPRTPRDGMLVLSGVTMPVTVFVCDEAFDYLVKNDGSGTIALRSCANGRFVSTELGYSGSSYGMLRARATAIGPWEEYKAVT